MTNNLIPIVMALSSYDHVHSITSGEVEIAGVAPTFVDLPIPEMFRRFINTQDWDVSEMSTAQYVTRRLQGDDSIIGIPVFTSRMFRHSSIIVRKDRIHRPEDLRGARIGITEWILSACVWARGMLEDMYGIRSEEITWVQAGMDRPGRAQAVLPPYLSDEVTIIAEPERTLEDMLWSGEIDAVMAPQFPLGFRTAVESSELVGPLFDNLASAERAYFEQTRVLPIMHTLGIRRELHERYPWLATNVYRAFEVSRRRYFARLEDIAASRTPLPWVRDYVRTLRETFGPDIWPYGLEPNRVPFETFLRYAARQGLIETADVDLAHLFVKVDPFVDGM